MMPYLLLLGGLLLIFLEFFLPGAVLGTIGALLILLSIAFFASTASAPLYIVGYLAVVVVLLVAVVQLALRRIRRSAAHDSFYLKTDQAGFRADSFDADLVGRDGIAATDLRPAGRIIVDGIVYQAMSQGGFITRDTPITITGGEGATLIVKPTTPELPSC
jgi:membrane-bound ClpP family serine protease